MILIDTSAIYALADRNDVHHVEAVGYYDAVSGDRTFVITLPIVTECCWLLETRLGPESAWLFVDDVIQGAFRVHVSDEQDLKRAVQIDRHYRDAGFGFADACSLAACERLKLTTVFTFDRRDFTVYRTTGRKALKLVP